MEAPFVGLFVTRFANRLAQNVTIYTNGNATATTAFHTALSELKPTSKTAKSVTVESQKIVKIVKGNKKAEVVVHLQDGSVRTEGFLAHAPKGVVNGPWVEQLGLELTEHGKLVGVAPFNETSCKGVFAAGDAVLMMAAVTPAIASGGAAAAGIAAQLGAED
jgi:thioredoxin reductase